MTVLLEPGAAALGACCTAAVGEQQQEDSVALFQQNWTTYQKLLHVDFLEHSLLYGAVHQALTSLPASVAEPGSTAGTAGAAGAAGAAGGGIAMLDLGCGDAMQIARTLQRCAGPAGPLRLASYTGVDVSAPALALASDHLAFLLPACSVQLAERDMVAFVKSCPDAAFHLAFASFAVHHLSTLQAKAEFLCQVARCLKPEGALLLVDIFMLEGEDREQYMQRYDANMAEAVQRGIIQPAEAGTVMDHVSNFDFPERLSDYEAAALAAGFAGGVQCLATDSKQFGRTVLLRKAAA